MIPSTACWPANATCSGTPSAHLLLPAAILGYLSLAYIARMTRSFMLEQLRPGIRAWRRGPRASRRWRVVWRACAGQYLGAAGHRHGAQLRQLLEGAVLTETVFAWPGLGLYITELAVQRRHERRAGRHGAGRRGLHRAQHALRPALPAGRPARARTVDGRRTCIRHCARLAAEPGARLAAARRASARWYLALARLSPQSAGDGRAGHRLAAGADGGLRAAARRRSPPLCAGACTDRLAAARPAASGSAPTSSAATSSPASSTARASRSPSSCWSRVIVVPVGLAIGTVAGYLGGVVDAVLMRITDIFLAFPRLILALAFVAALGPGIENAVIAIALTAWPPYARARPRRDDDHARRADFIRPSELQGASHLRIIAAPHRAALPVLGDRAADARHGRHHPDRRRPRLPRPRRAAADAGMGRDGLLRPRSSCSTSGGSRPFPASPSSSSASASTCWATACATCSIRKQRR